MNDFKRLIQKTGLSLMGAKRLLQVSYDSTSSWNTGRRNCPPGVIEQLEEYAEAADRIFVQQGRR